MSGGPALHRSLPASFRTVLRWGPAVGCAGLIFFLSHQSFSGEEVPLPDYVGHAVAYFALGASLVWGYSDLLRSGLTSRQAVFVWLWSTAYGALDEFHQAFIPLREPSLGDWFVDSAAALAAATIGWLLLRNTPGLSPSPSPSQGTGIPADGSSRRE